MEDFRDWLHKNCCYWYMLTLEQEDEYFSQWYDEVYNGKEDK